MADTVRLLYNCPCIALWTVFNEGWGQFDALDMANELKKLDPTRFIDHASGWQDQGYEEMKSRHIYFRPVKLKNDGRALALTEYGGHSPWTATAGRGQRVRWLSRLPRQRGARA